MSSLFLKIVNMSIAASWLILVVILMRVILKKAPKWINVLLWGIVAIRLICPLSFESALSLIPSNETIPLDIGMDTTPAIDSGINAINNAVNPIISQSNTPVIGASANPLQITIGIYECIWIFGMAAMCLYAMISYVRLRKKVGASIQLQNNIWLCDDIQTPFILGCFKPKIYILSGTDEAQLSHIIAHENAHLKRRDHLWKALGFIVLAVHWFNPLVWVAYILLCRDIELACDEKVIRELNQSESIAYSEALLACSVNRRTVMVCPLAFGEVGVKERVKRVLNYKKPAFWIVVVAVIASVILAVCFLTNPEQSKDSIPTAKCGMLVYYETIDEYKENRGSSVELPAGDALQNLISLALDAEKSATYMSKPMDFPRFHLSVQDAEGNEFISVAVDSQLMFTSFTNETVQGNHFLSDDSLLYSELEKTFVHYVSNQKTIFKAIITELHDGYYLVEPVEGSRELSSSDRIEVPIKNAEPSPEPEVGDIIEIEYSGEILETYPARIADVYGIKVVEESDVAENDLLKVFYRSKEYDKTVSVTDYVYADDGAYGLEGVVQYEDETGTPWKLAFIRDGVSFPVSMDFGKEYKIASELTYLGNGVVQVYVENTNNGTFNMCKMEYSYDETEKQTNFKAITEGVSLSNCRGN